MPTPAQLEQVRRSLNTLSGAAFADWRRVWGQIPAGSRATMSRHLAAAWVEIIERYGDIAAELGAEWFEQWARDLGIEPRLHLAAGADEARAIARLGWALSTPDQAANARGLLDELVKQPYRSTLQKSALRSGAAWARVPSGLTTCDWCLMLASRGAVYRSAELAERGTNGLKYHGDCDCIPTLIRGPQDYPPGYDPERLYREYKARQARTTLTVPKSAQVEPHELDTAAKIAARGHKVEFLPAANIQGVKTPDLLVDGVRWEMKSPQGKGRHTISHQMQRAAKQADRMVFDTSRTPLNDQQIVDEVRRRVSAGQYRLKTVWVVLKDGTWVEINAPGT